MQNIQNRYGVSQSWGLGRRPPPSRCRAAPGSPGLASAVGRNWTQGARIGIGIRIVGRTTSRVLFRRWPWMRRARPS